MNRRGFQFSLILLVIVSLVGIAGYKLFESAMKSNSSTSKELDENSTRQASLGGDSNAKSESDLPSGDLVDEKNSLTPTKSDPVPTSLTPADENKESGETNADSNSRSDSLSNAGKTGSLKGILIDAETRLPLELQECVLSFKLGNKLHRSKTITDSKGNFTLKSVPKGRSLVRVQVPGYLLTTKTIHLKESTPGEEIPFLLHPGKRIVGEVISSDGSPIPEASLRFLPLVSDGYLASSRSLKVKSDVQGRFQLAPLANLEGEVIAFKKGFRSSSPHRLNEDPSASESHREIRIILKPDLSVPIQLVSKLNESPLENIEVSWRLEGYRPGALKSLGLKNKASSDAEGLVMLQGLPDNSESKVSLNIKGSTIAPKSLTVQVKDLEQATLVAPYRIACEQAASLFVRVYSADGNLASNVKASLSGNALLKTPRLTSTSKGELHFKGIPLGKVHFLADGGEQGYASLTLEPKIEWDDAIAVHLKKHEGLISGKVEDPAGKPIPGAQVIILKGKDTFSTGSDAEGQFTFDGIPKGSYQLVARSKDYGEERFLNLETPTTNLTIKLQKTGTVVGSIEFDGPQRPYSLRLTPVEVGSENSGLTPFRRSLLFKFTARDQKFICKKVPAGSYHLKLLRSGQVLHELKNITVRAGQIEGPFYLQENPPTTSNEG